MRRTTFILGHLLLAVLLGGAPLVDAAAALTVTARAARETSQGVPVVASELSATPYADHHQVGVRTGQWDGGSINLLLRSARTPQPWLTEPCLGAASICAAHPGRHVVVAADFSRGGSLVTRQVRLQI